ncbi:MAG TPA: hypothetical protein VIL85_17620, partial [Thermomicrobiales bacterium]
PHGEGVGGPEPPPQMAVFGVRQGTHKERCFHAPDDTTQATSSANALGADFTLHYMDVPSAELYRRLAIRNRTPAEGVFVIPETDMARYITIFQPPTADELV